MYSLFKISSAMTTDKTAAAAPTEIDSDYIPCPTSLDTFDYITLNNSHEEEEEEEDEEGGEEEEQEDGENEPTSAEAEEEQEVDVLNENDADEARMEDKLYIISINGIPHYYENSLNEARNQMLTIANYFVGNLNENEGAGHLIITDNNLKKVKVVAPYTFLMLTYNYVIHELSIEYVVKRENL
jgi:hypothetical protein